jgi:hypothetical protein
MMSTLQEVSGQVAQNSGEIYALAIIGIVSVPLTTLFTGLVAWLLKKIEVSQDRTTKAVEEAGKGAAASAEAAKVAVATVKDVAATNVNKLERIEHLVNSAAEKAARREEQLIQQLARLGQAPEAKPRNGSE